MVGSFRFFFLFALFIFLFFSLFLLSLDGGGFYISTSILVALTFTAAFLFLVFSNFQLRLSRTYRECFVERSSEPKQYVSCNETPSSMWHLDESESEQGIRGSFGFVYLFIFIFSSQFFFHQNL